MKYPTIRLCPLILLPIAWSCSYSSTGYTPPTPAERIIQDISFLADDAREGRGVGTEGLATAAQYLVEQFADAGLEPYDGSNFLRPFDIDPSAPALAHAGISAMEVSNVVGIIPGAGDLAGETVVVGAHYDHLGFGGFGSLDADSVNVVHNGADDNASGTATMLEIARMLNGRQSNSRRTIVFIAFTAEELGLIGSAEYVKDPAFPNDSTFFMLNLDMVGRMEENRLAVFGVESAEELPALLDSFNIDHDIEMAGSGDGYGRSDHQSFYTVGIPVLHFFTGTHEQYHRTTDDSHLINAEGAAKIASLGADMVSYFAERREPLTFIEAPPPQMTTSGGYGAYLGTIPDMTESPDGVRLSGVREGSPAEEAGIQSGDILIGLGDFDITNLFEMTDALRAYKPGDRVSIRVRRDGEVLELETVLGRRGG